MEERYKAIAYQKYVRARKLAFHNMMMKKYHLVDPNVKVAQNLERMFPDFKEAFNNRFGNQYD